MLMMHPFIGPQSEKDQADKARRWAERGGNSFRCKTEMRASTEITSTG